MIELVNGATVVEAHVTMSRSEPNSGTGVVLAYRADANEWVTWGIHKRKSAAKWAADWGHYKSDFDAAKEDFDKRVIRGF